MLAEISELFESDPDKGIYTSALATVGKSKNHSDKIAVIKELVPVSLKHESQNPIGFLHSALSIGLHDATEDDCLAIASGIRQFLAKVIREVHNVRLRRDESTIDVAKLRGILDKYKPAT